MSTLRANQITDVAGTGSPEFPNGVRALQSGIAVTASGTAVDFIGIPSWAKRITVMFSGVSLNGGSLVQVQLGAGSVQTTGYGSGGSVAGGTNSVTGLSSTTGLLTGVGAVAANIASGSLSITLVTGTTWVAAGSFGFENTNFGGTSGGRVTLGGALDRLRITTVNGTDTFDAGTINILWE